jgi:hypothetical protein
MVMVNSGYHFSAVVEVACGTRREFGFRRACLKTNHGLVCVLGELQVSDKVHRALGSGVGDCRDIGGRVYPHDTTKLARVRGLCGGSDSGFEKAAELPVNDGPHRCRIDEDVSQLRRGQPGCRMGPREGEGVDERVL